MKRLLKIAFAALFISIFLVCQTSAAVPYSTYIYTIDGEAIASPHAYVPDRTVTSADMKLLVALNDPSDIEVDEDENVYIADSSNNRIILCDSNYKVTNVIDSFTNDQGVADSLATPSGVFVKDDEIFVADTDNNRIVVFDKKTCAFKRRIEEPTGDVFPENHIYKPIALAVDNAGRIYVISSTTHYGVIQLNGDGSFIGFLGAQKTNPTAWEIFWRAFQTDAQRAQSKKLVPTEYNNITIDESGFVYVTTNSIDPEKQQSAIESKDKSGDYAPVKKLNPSGYDVMQRTGFYPPSGEIDVQSMNVNPDAVTGASSIVDVALGPNGMWSIIDANRQKIYTYDEQGNLLFIFGDKGMQLGNLQNVNAITYKGTNILVLDKTTDSITVYKRTEYGDCIAQALQNTRDRNYDDAARFWTDILQRNANFDQSYIGIADSLKRDGDYEQAELYYSYATDTEGYSEAFKAIRKQWIEKYIVVIPIVLIVFFVLVSKFNKYTRKVNKAGQVTKDKRTFKEALIYGFHIIYHPFDGFWDMKHEKRGNLKGSLFCVFLTILAFIYQTFGTAYIFNADPSKSTIFGQVLSVLTPFLLFCVANWCLTTLFDGEGSFKDIVMATGYALLPIPILVIPATLISNVLSLDEQAIISLLVSFAYIWTGLLLFFGMMVIHDYTIGKNVLTTLGTIVGMAFIMFIGVLFSGLLTKVFSFVYNIFVELSYRA